MKPQADDLPTPPPPPPELSRRALLRLATLLAAAPGTLASANTPTRGGGRFDSELLCEIEDLAPGSALHFSYPTDADPCVLVRLSDGRFAAYSQVCTHLGCLVAWDPDYNRLLCPCHNGAYAIETGEVLQGPPPDPLPRILVETHGGAVWAVGVGEDLP